MYESGTRTHNRLIMIFVAPMFVLIAAIFLFFQQFSVPSVYATEPAEAVSAAESVPVTTLNTAQTGTEMETVPPSTTSPTTSEAPVQSEQALTFLIGVTVVCVVITTGMILVAQIRSRSTRQRIEDALNQQSVIEVRRQQRAWLNQEMANFTSRQDSDKIIDLQNSLEPR